MKTLDHHRKMTLLHRQLMAAWAGIAAAYETMSGDKSPTMAEVLAHHRAFECSKNGKVEHNLKV
jgi:hypothetical protein